MDHTSIPRKQAERICSEEEFDLIKSSWESGARSPQGIQKREKIKRVRRLRDKYRDIARRESRRVRRAGLTPGEIPVAPAPSAPPPLTRLQRILLERRPPPLKPPEKESAVVLRKRKPSRIRGDFAAERAARKAQIFDQALARLSSAPVPTDPSTV